MTMTTTTIVKAVPRKRATTAISEDTATAPTADATKAASAIPMTTMPLIGIRPLADTRAGWDRSAGTAADIRKGTRTAFATGIAVRLKMTAIAADVAKDGRVTVGVV